MIQKQRTLLRIGFLSSLLVAGGSLNDNNLSQTVIAKDLPQPPIQLAQASQKEIVIVFASRRDATDLEAKAEAVSKILSQQIGVPVKAVIASESAAVEALRANRADVAFLGGRAAIQAEKTTGAKLYLAEVRNDYSGGHTYKSVLVVRNDSPLKKLATKKQTLEQVRGKKWLLPPEPLVLDLLFRRVNL